MEENKIVEKAVSTQKSLLSCHDPGWNDPPQWAFSPTSNDGVTPTKRLLNKRVAFPLNSGSRGSSSNDQSPSNLSANLPPPIQSCRLTTAPHAPLSTPTGKVKSSDAEGSIFDKNEALKETMENLEFVITKKLEAGNKIEEVGRRLDIMKELWKDDKFADKACEKVLEISRALKNDDVEDADKIHVDLMMEHATICNTWISGIRHMILELREKSSESSVSKFSQDSFLLPEDVKKDEDK